MDMGTTASMLMASMTGAMPGASSAPTADSMDDMMMGGCKISMLWNWYTVDACFISSQWRVTSSGYFAGTCIGVICLTMCLPFLRNLHQKFDQRIIYQNLATLGISHARPTVIQQSMRALLFTLQFAVAYFVMLLAMYFNGYIIISIFIGAFLGYVVFEWHKMGPQVITFYDKDTTNKPRVINSKQDAAEVTGCCG